MLHFLASNDPARGCGRSGCTPDFHVVMGNRGAMKFRSYLIDLEAIGTVMQPKKELPLWQITRLQGLIPQLQTGRRAGGNPMNRKVEMRAATGIDSCAWMSTGCASCAFPSPG